MTQRNQIYRCPICGNVIEIVHEGANSLVCCGHPMELQEEKTTHQEFSAEKHVPVIEKTATGIKVKIGSIPHPMEEAHYIEFIEIITADGKVGKKFLNPGDVPEAEFDTKSEVMIVREYCNIHGLWINKL